MLQNIPKEKILEVVRQGPTIPARIVKIVGGDTMLIGAILSTLISSGDISYTSLKIGGSPLYYMKDQEARLEEYMNYLNEKDRKTVGILKESKILLFNDQDSLVRVSLQAVKDFAKQFELDGNMFYRYFLVTKNQAIVLAKELLKSKAVQEEIAPEKQTLKETVEEKPQKPRHITHKHSQKEEKKEDDVQEKIIEIDKAESVKEEKHPVTEGEREEKEEKEPKKDFFEIIRDFLHKKNLDIISKEKIKRSEYNLVLKNHDTNEYIYCVAKDKKTANEGDLATAYVFAQNKKMPCIFLMTGTLSKKAEGMLHSHFKELRIEKIE